MIQNLLGSYSETLVIFSTRCKQNNQFQRRSFHDNNIFSTLENITSLMFSTKIDENTMWY